MAVVFHPGQSLGQDDLKISIRDSGGQYVDPFYIRYMLFDNTTGSEILIGPPDRIPATTGVGQYYVNATLPLDANIGDWVVRWNFRETATSPLVQVAQEFGLVKTEVMTSVTNSLPGDVLVRRLRILLRDNNPDRNYRFRPPAREQFIQAQAQVFGYIWEDEELFEYVLMSIDNFNSAPPVTGVDLNNLPDRWRTTILMRAAGMACAAVAMNWIADEFSVAGDEFVNVRDLEGQEYTISIEDLFDIVYGDMMEEINRRVREEFLEDVEKIELSKKDFSSKADMEPPIKLQGIKRPLFSEKIKEAFQAGALKVRAMLPDSEKAEWLPVSDVIRHQTPHKKILHIHTEKSSIKVTEDHSIFLFEDKKPVSAKSLSIGNKIVGVDENGEFEPLEIVAIDILDPIEKTFDLSVPGAENFSMTSGILAHNSYSISGVSLDIDKSSKYESMKNNFYGEADKSQELAKRSIKIIKGLTQPRYGVGISSALGPFSKPGVQSRRNFTSGGRGGWS
jgi:hypothetical protein